MKVNLGEFQFDPVEPTDFRLAIEGASGTGKTNTISCILEDLADTNIPTLVIERLGVLSSVRQKDQDLVLVSNDEEADLTIPLEELDIVGKLVLDQGLKIILDVQSYKDPGSREYEAHGAAAKALSGLYNRARERFKKGKRRKCLLVADEVHFLAPERTSGQVDRSNASVKRCLSIFTRIATEGGNLGINQIVAYQRRALTTKNIVTQFTDKIIHRLHSVDRKSAAKEIGIDEAKIKELGTGEAFIYGDFTDHEVVGPVKVRKRTTPDPREENFELVEPPDDIKKILEDVKQQVRDKKKERKEKESKIKQLTQKVKRLKKQNEELKEKAHIKEGLVELLTSGQNIGSDEVKDKLEKLEQRNKELTGKKEKIKELRTKIQELRKKLEKKEVRIKEQKAQIREYQELHRQLEKLKPSFNKIAKVLGIEFHSEDVNKKLAKEHRRSKEEIKSSRNAKGKIELLKDERVQEYVKEISRDTPANVSSNSIRKILLALASSKDPLIQEEIQKSAGYKYTVTRATISYLKEKNLVEKTENDGEKAFDLAENQMDQITESLQRRKQVKELEKTLNF